jgi:ADP-ribosylglycohydrolase
MAALTLTEQTYRDKIHGAWTGKSIGVTLGASLRGQKVPGRFNFYSPVPGQPVPSVAIDFPLVWLAMMEEVGPEVAPEDLAVAWLEHLDYAMDEFGYAALNLRRGLPPPASGAYSNWFRHATGGVMRADFWAMLAPGAPQVAAAYAYHDATMDHCEDGEWAAMFLAALGSAAFFIAEPMTLLTIGLAMIPRTCRTARAVKAALAAAHRAASWLEARESVQHEVGHENFSDAPQNIGFLTIGLLYGGGDFGASLCAAVNCGYDTEAVGSALGAILGIQRGYSNLPEAWTRPIGDIVIPGHGLRDLEIPSTLTEVANRTFEVGKKIVAVKCGDVDILSGDSPTPSTTLAFLPELSELPSTPEGTGEKTEGSPPKTEDAVGNTPTPEEESTQTPEYPNADIAGFSASATLPPLPLFPLEAPPVGVPSTSPGGAGQTSPPVEATSALPSLTPSFTAPDLTPSAPPPAGSSPEPVLTDNQPPAISHQPPVAAQPPADPVAEPMPENQSSAVSHQPPVTPQPVSETPAIPLNTGASPSPGVAPRLAPDYTTAIAWADNTLVKPLLVTPPNAIVEQAGPFQIVMDSGEAPCIGYNHPKVITFAITNRGGDPFSGRIALLAPSGWMIGAPQNFGQRQYIAANTGTIRVEFTLRVPEGQGRIDIANALVLRFTPENGAPAHDAEFVLMGASCWYCVGPFANFDGEGFDRSYLPEDRPGLHESYTNRLMQAVRWEKWSFPETTLQLEPLYKGSSGVCYGQTILRSATAREARLVANTNSGVKMWLNGMLVLRRFQREIFRPSIGSGNWAVDVNLQAGDNVVMVKWVRGVEPYQFSLTVADRFGRGLPEVGNTNW